MRVLPDWEESVFIIPFLVGVSLSPADERRVTEPYWIFQQNLLDSRGFTWECSQVHIILSIVLGRHCIQRLTEWELQMGLYTWHCRFCFIWEKNFFFPHAILLQNVTSFNVRFQWGVEGGWKFRMELRELWVQFLRNSKQSKVEIVQWDCWICTA